MATRVSRTLSRTCILTLTCRRCGKTSCGIGPAEFWPRLGHESLSPRLRLTTCAMSCARWNEIRKGHFCCQRECLSRPSTIETIGVLANTLVETGTHVARAHHVGAPMRDRPRVTVQVAAGGHFQTPELLTMAMVRSCLRPGFAAVRRAECPSARNATRPAMPRFVPSDLWHQQSLSRWR